MEKTITLNKQQVELLTILLGTIAYEVNVAEYSNTTKAIVRGILTKLNEE